MRFRRFAWMMVGASIGAALCVSLRWWMSPFQWLSDDKIQVYILSSCRGSQIAAREFSVAPADGVVQLIPFDNYGDELATSLCQRVVKDVEPRNPLLRFIPDKFACNWLAQDARVHYGNVGYFPVMVFQGEILSHARQSEVFAQLGLKMSTTHDTFGLTAIAH